MVVVEWLRQVEQNLKQPLRVRRRKQVHAPRHMRDALAGIVDDDG